LLEALASETSPSHLSCLKDRGRGWRHDQCQGPADPRQREGDRPLSTAAGEREDGAGAPALPEPDRARGTASRPAPGWLPNRVAA
jgi:hypothetical protein